MSSLLRTSLISHLTPLLSPPLPSSTTSPPPPTPSSPASSSASPQHPPSTSTSLPTPQNSSSSTTHGASTSLIPPTALVLVSHEGFDDTLTTEYNPVLAEALGVAGPYECIRGYKGDSERRIGIVGWMLGVGVEEFIERVERDFEGLRRWW
ncbi:hypothetical protein BDD12DRAFT_233124 [Trichophaea hybrida]|nr:hypothetical protein BDD12DRAFT_233124 [Trichophaea hybrida]